MVEHWNYMWLYVYRALGIYVYICSINFLWYELYPHYYNYNRSCVTDMYVYTWYLVNITINHYHPYLQDNPVPSQIENWTNCPICPKQVYLFSYLSYAFDIASMAVVSAELFM